MKEIERLQKFRAEHDKLAAYNRDKVHVKQMEFHKCVKRNRWALLFLALFVYQLKDSKKREEKYTATITSLTEGLNALEGIKQDIKSIIDTIDATVDIGESFFAKKKSAKSMENKRDKTE